MKNYYAVLGLKPGCEQRELRRAYRTLAKELHPDTATEKKTARFLILKEAYEVLSNPATREAYDRIRRAAHSGGKKPAWNYRDFLKSRKNDPALLTKLICYDLLHDLDSEALDLYDGAQTGGFFSLKNWLDREDFMDFAFLLAEAYLERGAMVKAYRLFWEIAELEEQNPYFKHFYVEVLDNLAAILRHPLPDDPEETLRIAFLRNLLNLNYNNKDRDRLGKLLAELLAARGKNIKEQPLHHR